MSKASKPAPSFAAQAERVLALPVAYRVNALGGYGPGSEVIYEAHPPGCPSALRFLLTLHRNQSRLARVPTSRSVHLQM